MCKKMIYLISLVLVLVLAGSASAATLQWDKGGQGNLWNVPENWNPDGEPTADDTAQINLPGDANKCIIDSSVDAQCQTVFIGAARVGPCFLEMTGGSLTANGNFQIGQPSDSNGVFTMSGGTATSTNGRLWVGMNGSGTFIMKDGELNIYDKVEVGKESRGNGTIYMQGGIMNLTGNSTDLEIGNRGRGTIYMTGGVINLQDNIKLSQGSASQTTGVSRIYLYGGTINAGNLRNPADGIWGNPLMDIKEGKLVLPGDYTAMVNDYINRGWIIAYGSEGTVIVTFAAEPNVTTVTGRIPNAELPRKPSPRDGEIDVPRDSVSLSWIPGLYAVKHNVYFGKDFNDVNEATIADSRGVLASQNQEPNSFTPPELLDFGKTYYWRIDEVNDSDPNGLWKGSVWSFTAVNFTIVDDFEGYDDVNNLIYNVWTDFATNNTGMTVGHLEPPYAELTPTNVHGGEQSMYMRYDNDGTVNEGTAIETIGTKYYSQADRQWSDPQDWTKNDANSLTIWFKGLIAEGTFTPGSPIKMTGAGTDIGGNSDQFHFAYKQLTGSGSITANVLSLTNTNTWAMAGVMVRETLDAGSKHATMVITLGQGASFRHRINPNYVSAQEQTTGITAPQWVRLTRSGNTFTGEYSANGANWTAIGSLDITMLEEVYVGLIVTSRNIIATCTAEFSDVDIDGTATGDWQSQDIGTQSNTPAQLYVALEDNANNSALVRHSDPASSAIPTWTRWNIPLSDFTGVNPPWRINLQAIQKMSIGVGDSDNPQRGGTGTLYIDDIRLYLSENAQ